VACLREKGCDLCVCASAIGDGQCSGTSPSIPRQSPTKSFVPSKVAIAQKSGDVLDSPASEVRLMRSALPPVVRFADFEVDVRAGELRKDGSKVRLQEQPFLLLTVLLESAGEVVTREELRKRLWSADTFVDFDHRLAVAVSKLGWGSGEKANKHKLVLTHDFDS
jgi:DNA-binding response OmpR family regulator